jgi:hypothetical protein
MNWKEELITGCLELQRERASLDQARAEDEEIKNLELTMKKVMDKLSELERPYTDKATSIIAKIENMHDQLKEKWDITDKTYECDAGIATVRTTKSLKIIDKKRLITILLNIDKLPEAIRSWNLSYLRKLKDVDMIDGMAAHYEEHQNVVIKGAEDK